METLIVALFLAAVLSLGSEAVLHRVTLAKAKNNDDYGTRQAVDIMLARFSSIPSHESQSKPRSRIEQQPSQPGKTIDSERLPVQYNPTRTAFIGTVGIGTPPQYFHMLFDIASADTWVAMTMANCTPPYENTHPCPAHRRYFHPSRSSTFEKVPNTLWSIEFSDKSKVFGNEHTDMMQIGGHVLDRQVFGVGKALYGTKDDGIDGSVGLGLSDLKTGENMSPLENLAMQDGIMPLVGIWLGSGGQGGEIIFGGNDKSRHSGELSMFDIPEGSVYWSVPVHSLLVVHPLPKPSSAGSVTTLKPMTTTSAAIPVTTSGKIPPAPAPGMQVNGRIGSGTRLDMPNIIFDTSSDLILLPPRVAASTHRYIHNSFFGLYSGYNLFTGLYTVPCTLDADIYFDIGARTVDNRSPLAANSTSDSSNNDNNGFPSQHRFKVKGKDLVRERVPVFGIFNQCFSGIQASQSNEDDWVFGNLWFLSNYMSLNLGGRQIGIAPSSRPEEEE